MRNKLNNRMYTTLPAMLKKKKQIQNLIENMKIKIRKVEVTQEEFFNELSIIISLHEKIPQNKYIGTGLEYVCRNMGVKPLEFWKLKFENEEYFDNRFVIKTIGRDGNMFLIWRKEKYESLSSQ